MFPKFPKILTIIFLVFIILQINGFLFLNLFYSPAQAINTSMPKLQIDIPTVKLTPAICKDGYCEFPWIGQYVTGIYTYAIGIVGILAAVVLMIGGIIWVVAGGNATRVGEAKAWIGASLTGLVIALTSYMILYQINPKLTQFEPIKVKQVEKTEGQKTTSSKESYQKIANKTAEVINDIVGMTESLVGIKDAIASGGAAGAGWSTENPAILLAGIGMYEEITQVQEKVQSIPSQIPISKDPLLPMVINLSGITAKAEQQIKEIKNIIDDPVITMPTDEFLKEIGDALEALYEAEALAEKVQEEAEQAAEEDLLCAISYKVSKNGRSYTLSNQISVNSEAECTGLYNYYKADYESIGYTVLDSSVTVLRVRATTSIQ